MRSSKTNKRQIIILDGFKNHKGPNPNGTCEYIVAQQIGGSARVKWWVQHSLKSSDHMISKVKLKYCQIRNVYAI